MLETDLNEQLRMLYEEKGLSLSEIAMEVGLSSGAVRNRLIGMGVERRSRGGANNQLGFLDKRLLKSPEETLEILDDPQLSMSKKAYLLQVHESTIRAYFKKIQQEKEDLNGTPPPMSSEV